MFDQASDELIFTAKVKMVIQTVNKMYKILIQKFLMYLLLLDIPFYNH
jgi:hypothetical protein